MHNLYAIVNQKLSNITTWLSAHIDFAWIYKKSWLHDFENKKEIIIVSWQIYNSRWKRNRRTTKLLDCSQSLIFPWNRRCRSLSPKGRHLGLLKRAKLERVQNACIKRPCWNRLTSMRAHDMKNTSLCFVTRGRVVVVVKSKPSHNWFKSIVERSWVEKSRKRVRSSILD